MSIEHDLIRRLTSYIEASSLSNTDHWRISKLRREATAYLEAPPKSGEVKLKDTSFYKRVMGDSE